MPGIYIKDITLDEFWEDYGEGASYLCGTGRVYEIPDARMENIDEQPYFKKHYKRKCCSNCKKEVREQWSFCPYCGARFIKEKK